MSLSKKKKKRGLKGSARRGVQRERGRNDIKCEIFWGDEKASKYSGEGGDDASEFPQSSANVWIGYMAQLSHLRKFSPPAFPLPPSPALLSSLVCRSAFERWKWFFCIYFALWVLLRLHSQSAHTHTHTHTHTSHFWHKPGRAIMVNIFPVAPVSHHCDWFKQDIASLGLSPS